MCCQVSPHKPEGENWFLHVIFWPPHMGLPPKSTNPISVKTIKSSLKLLFLQDFLHEVMLGIFFFFFASVKMTYDFCSLFMRYTKFSDFIYKYVYIYTFTQPWMPEEETSWLQCLYLLMHFWIQFTVILLRYIHIFLHFSSAWKSVNGFFVIFFPEDIHVDIKFNWVFNSFFLMAKDAGHFKRNFMLSVFILFVGGENVLFSNMENVFHLEAY